MGVYKRGKTWYIRYTADGREVRESTGQESKRLAEAILRKRKTQVAENRHLDRVERPEMTMRELCEWYWQHHGRKKKGHGVKGTLRRFKSYFGQTPLVAVTPEMVAEYAEHRIAKDGVTRRTANRDLQEMKGMFNRVIQFKRWRRVLENPVAYVKLAKERNERVRYLEADEIKRLLKAAKPHLKPILVTALHTGMRRGEILNLQWKDVDFKNRIVTVAEAKGGEGRHIPMSNELYELLLTLPSRFRGGHVFPSFLPRRKRDSASRGSPFTDLKNSFSAALKEAKIEDFRFHDLRHCFASYLVMKGVDLNTVRELLGHKSLRMTLRYAHLSPGHKGRAVRLLDEAVPAKLCRSTGTKTGTPTVVPFRKPS